MTLTDVRLPRVLAALFFALGITLFGLSPVAAQDAETEPAAAETETDATEGSEASAPADSAAAGGDVGVDESAQAQGDADTSADGASEEGFSFDDDEWGEAWDEGGEGDGEYFQDGAGSIDALLEEPTWDGPRFDLKGYYRLRWKTLKNVTLDDDGEPDNFNFWQHRLRLRPTVWLNDKTAIHTDLLVGQSDRGCGVSPRDEDRAREEEVRNFHPQPCDGIFGGNGDNVLAQNVSDSFANVRLVRFWGEVTTPIGVFRAGRQPSHWGLGIFANDGLHESEFGDPEFGDTADRLLFATKPLGEDSDLVVALLYDLISEGSGVQANPTIFNNADDVNQGVIVALYDTDPLSAGLYQVFRRQSDPDNFVFATDLYGQIDLGLMYAALETVWLYGSTRALPVLDQADLEVVEGDTVDISAWLWAMELGLRFDWYDFKLKLGSASGDQNQLEGKGTSFDRKKQEQRRNRSVDGFSFRPDYNVGLIMFEHAVANRVERNIDQQFRQLGLLADQGLIAEEDITKLELAADLARTRGAVSNAFFVNPIFTAEPYDGLVMRLGYLWAKANAAFQVVGQGVDANFESNLGHELDASVEYTWRDRFSIGVEGGVFFPGDAFDRPRTIEDPVTGLPVELAGNLQSADPAFLGNFRVTFSID